ncbi:flagellar assembly peptidoglycan hydrolase FlgJ [Pseudomonadales bacterium]|nr:flagellar assembly peptidoglycan hydrolase FlgJ [Pseudomonadales bacterium]
MQAAGLNSLSDSLATTGISAGRRGGLGQDSTAYNDLSSLQNLKLVDGENPRQALNEIGRQFESLLVHQMLKSMRNASKVWSEGGLLNSDRVGFYQEMMDDQLSLEMTKGDGIGLAKQFTDDLSNRFTNTRNDEQEQAAASGMIDIARMRPVQSASVKVDASAGVADVTAVLSPSVALAAQHSAAPQSINSPEDFIAQLQPLANAAAEKLGVPSEAILAQAALESGWGQKVSQHSDGRSSHNLFGIKADQRWQGEAVTVNTLEYFTERPVRVSAQFRSYGSYAESFNDYVEFINTNQRYEHVTQDPQQYPRALQRAGYATDPAYAEKIENIMQRFEQKDGTELPLAGSQRAANDSVVPSMPVAG